MCPQCLRNSRRASKQYVFCSQIDNVIAFVNKRSGVQNGPNVINDLLTCLGEEKVFDLGEGGPKPGLEKHKHKTDLRVIACGGDGTVGWIMSILDELNLHHQVSVAIMPCGTGNDLGRVLGWGHKYTQEPVEKYLNKVLRGKIRQLDRWSITVKPPSSTYGAISDPAPPLNQDNGSHKLPLNVFNNYFSFGADAKIALDFHKSREKNPDRFNSIPYNKFVYAKHFVKDLLFIQSCKNTIKNIKVFECDGKDYMDRLRKLDCHSVVFVNIPSYANGRNPWKQNKPGFQEQSYSDGKFEVVGFHTLDLMWLQIGAHGDTIGQFSKVRIVTSSPLPFQVDGEACMLQASEIIIEARNKASMIIGPKS